MYSIGEDKMFKIYKRSSRPVLVLKASLPCIDSGEDGAIRFNGFYARLKEECADAAERLCNDMDIGKASGAYLSLTVSFEAGWNNNRLTICRKYEVKRGGERLHLNTVTDVFSSDLYFVSKLKKYYKTKKYSITERK